MLGLILRLGNFLEANPELGRLLPAPLDVVLSKPLARVIQPDLLVMTAETIARIERDNRLLGIPDLAIEVLSGDGSHDRGKKLPHYAEYRIPELWHVSQDRPRIEVYRTDRAGKLVKTADRGKGESLATPLLPGFELAIDPLYRGLLDTEE